MSDINALNAQETCLSKESMIKTIQSSKNYIILVELAVSQMRDSGEMNDDGMDAIIAVMQNLKEVCSSAELNYTFQSLQVDDAKKQ